MRRVAACCAFGLLLLANPNVQASSRSIVGSADVKVTQAGRRTTVRVVYSAVTSPALLRLEVLQAGQVIAVLFSDAERLQVLKPGHPMLVYEGPATRAGFDGVLGLPFCIEELIFTLRGGRAQPPACDGVATELVVRRDGRVTGLRRVGSKRGMLRFRGFRELESGSWPQRAILESEGAVATVFFGSLAEREMTPLALDGSLLARARRVDAATMRRALGLGGKTP